MIELNPETNREMKNGNSKLHAVILLFAFGFAFSTASAGDVTATVTVTGKLFNSSSRQHIQASFRGSGVHSSTGESANVDGVVSSPPTTRLPQRKVLGDYTVDVSARVRYRGLSFSESTATTVNVRRKRVIVGGFGKINLTRPLNSRKKNRQNFRGSGRITIDAPV